MRIFQGKNMAQWGKELGITRECVRQRMDKYGTPFGSRKTIAKNYRVSSAYEPDGVFANQQELESILEVTK